MTRTRIASVRGRRVWDSRGRPTVEAEVTLEGGLIGRAIAPAGASTGSGEAVDLRDGGLPFGGLDVSRAVAAVNGEIARALCAEDVSHQTAIDEGLVALDGTPNKARLGGNALIAVSMAVAHARAAALGMPLWQSLAGDREPLLPIPAIQLFGGGAHASRRIDIQDIMVVAVSAGTFSEALAMTAEVYRAAGAIMAETGRLAGVADEGGYWPAFRSNEEGLSVAVEAIERAGFAPGTEIALSLDIAASELGKDGRYRLASEDRDLDTEGMIALLTGWLKDYPVVSIEDPLAEDDEAGLIAFTEAAGRDIQVIGDDYLVTSAERVCRAQSVGACNAVLIKPNQAGTLTETKAALDAAHAAGWNAVVSARSGETEDVTVVHLAVGWGAGQLKVGSFSRSERMAKWNEGLRIADSLNGGRLPLPSTFPWGRGKAGW